MSPGLLIFVTLVGICFTGLIIWYVVLPVWEAATGRDGYINHGSLGPVHYDKPIQAWQHDDLPVQHTVPNAERMPVQAVLTPRTTSEHPRSAPNYSEQEIAAMLARILADVRSYNGSPGRYGAARLIETALGIKRGGSQEYAQWSAQIDAELRRLEGRPEQPPGPIAVSDGAGGSYTLERS